MSPSALSGRLGPLWRGPTLHNLIGAAATQLLLLVSGTLLARLLGPEKRGYLAILLAIPSAISQLGAVGMSLAATYYLSAGLIGGRELLALLRRPAALQVSLLTVVTAVCILLYALISHAPIVLAACLSLVIMPAVLPLDYGMALLLGARRHLAVNSLRPVVPGLTVAGVVPLYLASSSSVAAVMLVVVVTATIAGGTALRLGVEAVKTLSVPNSVVVSLGPAQARRTILAFGRQGYIGYLSPVDSFKLDQFAVGFLLSPHALGIYVVGAAFTNIGRLVAVNLGMSATPEIAAHSQRTAARRAVRHTLLLAAGILTALTLVLAAAVVEAIPLLFGAEYRSSIPVAEILLASSWLLSMKRVAVDVMRGLGEPRVGTWAEVVNVAAFLVTAVPFGLWLGGVGVALSLAVSAAGGSIVLIRGLQHLGAFDARASNDSDTLEAP